jgi:putative flippase GtrA
MIPVVAKLIHSRTGLAQFARYLIIGSTVFLIDLGSFQLLVHEHMQLVAAVVVSYVLGISTHFALNKYWNFRVFERSTANQARTYLVIALAQLPIAVAIVEAGVHYAKLPPIDAKILAILLNVPLSFAAHKYLTFGRGIRQTFKEIIG